MSEHSSCEAGLIQTVTAQLHRDESLKCLVEIMTEFCEFVIESEPLKNVMESHRTKLQEAMIKILAAMAAQITECAYFIRDYVKTTSFRKSSIVISWVVSHCAMSVSRAVMHSMSDADGQVQQYKDKFAELRLAFQSRAILHVDITVLRILDEVEDIGEYIDNIVSHLFLIQVVFYPETEVRLDDMPYANGAEYDPSKKCLTGTRNNIVDEIIDWVNSGENVPSIFLLTGVAGSGKSTIAHTVAGCFDKLKRLGASFCFDHAHQAERRLDIVFSTIGRDLADFDIEIKKSLKHAVQLRMQRRTTHLQKQFENFILKPVEFLKETIGPILIMIDGLNESGDPESREELLYVLASRFSELPSHFRILITARPEKDILDAFTDQPSVLWKQMDSIDRQSTDHDISLFIGHKLSGVEGLDIQWPGHAWCRLLTDKSEGLFQWAFTACRFIKGVGKAGQAPPARLKTILCSSISRPSHLDQLYLEVLNQNVAEDDPEAMAQFKLIMSKILAAREPLSTSSLNFLQCTDDPEGLTWIIKYLGALLTGANEQGVPVHPLHSSFHDFLVDPGRSQKYYVDLSLGHHSLAIACLQTMKHGLQFNICGLQTSYLLNEEVPELSTQVQNTIPIHLCYSCRYWAAHLQGTNFEVELAQEVQTFVHSQFLYWLEILSLLKEVNIASSAMIAVADWCKVSWLPRIDNLEY